MELQYFFHCNRGLKSTVTISVEPMVLLSMRNISKYLEMEMIIGKTVIFKAYFITLMLLGFSFLCFIDFWLTNNYNILWVFVISLVFLVVFLIYQSKLHEIRVNSDGFIAKNSIKKSVRKNLDDFLAVKNIVPLFGLGKIYFKDNTSYLFPIENRFITKAYFLWDLKKIENEVTISIENKILNLRPIAPKTVFNEE